MERDIYGTYNWDEFDDEYDLANFAPSRGKDGRRRKSDAGIRALQCIRQCRNLSVLYMAWCLLLLNKGAPVCQVPWLLSFVSAPHIWSHLNCIAKVVCCLLAYIAVSNRSVYLPGMSQVAFL